MIGLFPDHVETLTDPAAAVAAEDRTPGQDGVWVYTNMISSADGGTAVDGLSAQLGTEGDRLMFAAFRAVADFIVVGAATVRQEQYRPPTQSDPSVADRVARGQQPHPTFAIVSRSLTFDLELPVFSRPELRPVVLTTREGVEEHGSQVEEHADLIIAGETSVDFGSALSELQARGGRRILCEGGPSINGQLIDDGLVDEWNLTVAPSLLGADSKRAAVGPLTDGPPIGMKLTRVWADDDFLFCRWVRDAS